MARHPNESESVASAAEAPVHCPECGAKLSKAVQGKPHASKTSILLIFLGAFAALVGGITLHVLLPVESARLERYIALIGACPGFVAMGLGMVLPKLQTTRCHLCPWSETKPVEKKVFRRHRKKTR